MPPCYDENSEVCLVVFTDGGESASTARAYIRVRLKVGGFSVENLVNGFRLGELTATATPKTEIGGIVLGVRLINLIVSMMSHVRLNKIHLMTDSRAALGALSSFTSRMKLYYCY